MKRRLSPTTVHHDETWARLKPTKNMVAEKRTTGAYLPTYTVP